MYIHSTDKFQSSNSVDLSSHSAALSIKHMCSCGCGGRCWQSARTLCTTEEWFPFAYRTCCHCPSQRSPSFTWNGKINPEFKFELTANDRSIGKWLKVGASLCMFDKVIASFSLLTRKNSHKNKKMHVNWYAQFRSWHMQWFVKKKKRRVNWHAINWNDTCY